MNQLTPFKFHTHTLRVLPHDNGISFWMVGKDVSDALGFAEAKDVMRQVPEKHKGRQKVPTLGGDQEMLCVDEAGLYRLILRSNKPEAEPFMEWITAEVLPAIRRSGSYNAPAAVMPDQAERLAIGDPITAFELEALLARPVIISAKEYLALSSQKPKLPRLFTHTELATISKLTKDGVSTRAIARQLGRSECSIRNWKDRQKWKGQKIAKAVHHE
jgi:prophage antirepressor-like protein